MPERAPLSSSGRRRRLRTVATWAGVGAALAGLTATPGASAAGEFTLSLASLTSTGAQVADGGPTSASVSADGRFVVFASPSALLVAGDTNGTSDIFIRDTVARVTARLSVDCDGRQAIGGDSLSPRITPDGRFVVFESSATNLVDGDINGLRDIFVHEVATAVTRRVSVGVAGGQSAVADSTNPTISDDGRLVAFQSAAPNLAPGDLNGTDDVFVRDTLQQTTTLVSAGTDGQSAPGPSSDPQISGDGRFVVFTSPAVVLAGDDNDAADVFVRDLSASSTAAVSLLPGGGWARGASEQPTVSADGARIAFRSTAVLVSGDTNDVADILVADRGAGTLTRASVDSAGTQADGASGEAAISSSGAFVAFTSTATSLVPGDTNGVADVFVRGVDSAATSLASIAVSGVRANAVAAAPSTSATGRYVAFVSAADTLVPGDANGTADVFVADLLPPPGTPGTPTVVAGDTTATLTWTAPTDPAGASVTGYTVDAVATSAAAPSRQCTTPAATLTCTVTGLTNGTEYEVRVVATSASGRGAPSTPVSVTPGVVPGAPTGVVVTPADGSVVAVWDPMATSGGLAVTGFVVAAVDPGGAVTQCAAPPGATSCRVIGLTNGTSYAVSVLALNSAGPGPVSGAVSVIPAGVPGSPDGVVVTLDDARLTVSWAAPITTGGLPLTGYAVSVVPTVGSPAAGCAVAATTTTCDAGALVAGVPYQVRVIAQTSAGDSPPSAAVSVTYVSPAGSSGGTTPVPTVTAPPTSTAPSTIPSTAPVTPTSVATTST